MLTLDGRPRLRPRPSSRRDALTAFTEYSRCVYGDNWDRFFRLAFSFVNRSSTSPHSKITSCNSHSPPRSQTGQSVGDWPAKPPSPLPFQFLRLRGDVHAVRNDRTRCLQLWILDPPRPSFTTPVIRSCNNKRRIANLLSAHIMLAPLRRVFLFFIVIYLFQH